MTYFFETHGCQMNDAESAALEEDLRGIGYTPSPAAENADLVVINTCSVRATAETRIAGRLGWYAGLRKNGSPFTLVVTGCMAERLGEDISRGHPVVDYVVGTFEKSRIIGIALEKKRSGKTPGETQKEILPVPSGAPFSFPAISHVPGSPSSYVPIMHGCNNFCSYCIVPYVRGREISRDAADIFAEIDLLSLRNVQEITLLGQNVNSYQNGPYDFPALLRAIASRLRASSSSIKWVRFLTSHPKDLGGELLAVMAEESALCRHIHLPVQHGSSKILAAMNRRYTREDYLSRAAAIRAVLPDATLSTDILVGFPGETPADHEATLSLMKEVRFSEAYMYYYNPREGTPALNFPNPVPEDLKKARLREVIDLQLSILREDMAARINSGATVLVENISDNLKNRRVSSEDGTYLRGRTPQNHRVVFPGPPDLVGTFVDVTLTSLAGNTFRAKRTAPP